MPYLKDQEYLRNRTRLHKELQNAKGVALHVHS